MRPAAEGGGQEDFPPGSGTGSPVNARRPPRPTVRASRGDNGRNGTIDRGAPQRASSLRRPTSTPRADTPAPPDPGAARERNLTPGNLAPRGWLGAAAHRRWQRLQAELVTLQKRRTLAPDQANIETDADVDMYPETRERVFTRSKPPLEIVRPIMRILGSRVLFEAYSSHNCGQLFPPGARLDVLGGPARFKSEPSHMCRKSSR
jgi:hypothetical protein